MAYNAAFIIDAIGDDSPGEEALDKALFDMGVLLWALVDINCEMLRRYPDRFAPLYQAGIVYGEPNIVICKDVDDNWIDITTLYTILRGTCKELGAARGAELIVRYGLPRGGPNGVGPMVTMEEDPATGKDLYHVMVRWPDVAPAKGFGPYVYYDPELRMNVECPSSELGMLVVGDAARRAA